MKRVSAKRAARDRDYEKQRQAAYQRDKGRCVVGVTCPGEQTHHRQGRRIPDPHQLANLLTVCAMHHAAIHQRPEWARENGYMVPRLGVLTPETVPVRYGNLMVNLTNGDPT